MEDVLSSNSVSEVFEEIQKQAEEEPIGAAPEGVDQETWEGWKQWKMRPANDFMFQVMRGKQGENVGLSNGLVNVNKYIYGTHQARYYLIGADSGVGKCLGKGTRVIMYDGTLKAVEDVQTGDQLMGPDGTPRNVLSTCTGREQMYWVRQKRGVDYRVNESHILSLAYRPQNRWSTAIVPGQEDVPKNKRKRTYKLIEQFESEVVNLSVKEYLTVKNKALYQGWKSPVDFGNKRVKLDPYILGLWLGDGTCAEPSFTTTDPEVVTTLSDFAQLQGLNFRVRDKITYTMTNIRGKGNPVRAALRRYGLLGNKHIPQDYIQASKDCRLSLIAGLIDSDGYYNPDNNMVEITQKRKELTDQIVFVLRSLGFYVTCKEKTATMKREDGTVYSCTAHRISFAHCASIPCRVPRKQTQQINAKSLTTGIRLEKDTIDDYYGFVLDRDHLFLLEDFTVTHNTTIADFMYVLQAWADAKRKGRKIKIFYCSFEVGKLDKVARWCSYYIFLCFKVRLPSDYILGRIEGKLVSDEHLAMIQVAYSQVMEMMKDIVFVEDVIHPTKIFEDLIEAHFEKHGEVLRAPVPEEEKKKNPHKKGYVKGYKPHDPNMFTMLVIDHLALIGSEQKLDTKGVMDRMSKYMIVLRNIFHCTGVFIQQFSTDLMSWHRTNKKSAESIAPQRIDFGDSKATYRDADVVFGAVKPVSMDHETFMGYTLIGDDALGQSFVAWYLMKNRYGPSSRVIPLFLDGVTGFVYDLPLQPSNMLAMQEWYDRAREIEDLCNQFSPQSA